ncbi:hypothetical protein BDV96DRAFT_642517 [Lophiotrema nucula]|uniref:Uncharacterized protein n=1 Tax=Lophiotrema nucula TaxID=690887 RepID=A0A6A5ZK29_9PLEO|nr:hypothetical protein BDV96DRAFT_642517 [Lophiotrema nucula]
MYRRLVQRLKSTAKSERGWELIYGEQQHSLRTALGLALQRRRGGPVDASRPPTMRVVTPVWGVDALKLTLFIQQAQNLPTRGLAGPPPRSCHTTQHSASARTRGRRPFISDAFNNLAVLLGRDCDFMRALPLRAPRRRPQRSEGGVEGPARHVVDDAGECSASRSSTPAEGLSLPAAIEPLACARSPWTAADPLELLCTLERLRCAHYTPPLPKQPILTSDDDDDDGHHRSWHAGAPQASQIGAGRPPKRASALLFGVASRLAVAHQGGASQPSAGQGHHGGRRANALRERVVDASG